MATVALRPREMRPAMAAAAISICLTSQPANTSPLALVSEGRGITCSIISPRGAGLSSSYAFMNGLPYGSYELFFWHCYGPAERRKEISVMTARFQKLLQSCHRVSLGCTHR